MKSRVFFFYLLLTSVLCIASVLILITGETPWQVVWTDALQKLQQKTLSWNPLLDERLPRLIVIICTGASLAVAGAVMQSLFQNPLASPGTLGISCGGSLSIMLILIIGWHHQHPFAIPIAAFGGCLITLLFVYFLSFESGQVKLHHLLLTGIAVSTLLVTVQSALLYAFRDHWQLIQTLTEWQAGSTLDRNWNHVHMQLPLTLIGIAGVWSYRKEMNLLALGEEEAIHLGVNVTQVRWRLFLCVSLLTGGALAAVGMIAFFGLVLPHIVRKISGPDSRQVVPLCIVGGSALMAVMDLSLRVLSLHLISIGNVSAVLGGTFFLFLLLGSRKKEGLENA
jgi:iron complex transport system permease protein